MRALETGCGDDVLKSVFLEQLTPNCRAALAISNITEIKKLAEAADKYMESIASDTSQISSVNKNVSSAFGELKNEMSRMSNEFAALKVTVNKLSSQTSKTYRGRSQSRNRDRNNSTSKARDSKP